jgi:hypothetical protein
MLVMIYRLARTVSKLISFPDCVWVERIAEYKWILSTRPTEFQRTRAAGYAVAGGSNYLTNLLAIRTDVRLHSPWFYTFGEKIYI